MARATLYEREANKSSEFSFVLDISDDILAFLVDGTLPVAFPGVVVAAPFSGSAVLDYEILVVGSAIMGPVRLLQPEPDPRSPFEMVPLTGGDDVTIQVLGRT